MLKAIKQAIKLFISDWVLFGLIVLTVWLPAELILTHVDAYYLNEDANAVLSKIQVNSLIQLVFAPISLGAIAYSFSQIKQGLGVTYSQAMSVGLSKWWELFGTLLVANICVCLGLIFLIIPGIILALHYTFVTPVVVLEGRKSSDALRRSTALTKGIRWQILGAYILCSLGTMLLMHFLIWPLKIAGLSNNLFINVGLGCISSLLSVILDILALVFYWQAKEAESLNNNENYENI